MKINVSTSKIEELNYLVTWIGYEKVIQIFKPNSLEHIFFFEYTWVSWVYQSSVRGYS